MRLLNIGTLFAIAALVGTGAMAGCSSDSGPAVNYGGTGQTAAGTSSSGSSSTAGTTAGGSSSTAGTNSGGTAAGTTAVAGTDAGGMSGGGAGGTGTAGGTDAGGGAGGAGGGGGNDLFKPKPSAGCGKDPASAPVKGGMLKAGGWATADLTLDTTTPKGARARKYNIWLPQNYDPKKAYRVYYQGPGCGGGTTSVYNLPSIPGFDGIRVGLTYFPGEHEGTCFDDKQGDTSIEWPYFKAVHAIVKDNLCIDEHRVFATGVSSGSWLSNELACVSGSELIGAKDEHVIRATATTTGGLPTGQEVPTCTTTPFAGIWIHDLNDIDSNPYAGSQRAVERAIQVNKCMVNGAATKFDVKNTMYWEDYTITGAGRQICKKAKGCPAEYPLVMCSSMGQGHGDQADLAVPAYIQFLQSLNP